MKVDVLLGLQWGDEGKGKIVDFLAEKYNLVARFQGGPNAGHTLKFDNITHVLHQIPSGIFRKSITNIIGNGVVLDPVIFLKEIDELKQLGLSPEENLLISKRTQLILPTHKLLDQALEKNKGKDKIGSTLKGIGPTYQDKTGRLGLRVGDVGQPSFKEKYKQLKHKHEEMLSQFGMDNKNNQLDEAFFHALQTLDKFQMIDSEYYINHQLDMGSSVLAEGAQGSLLDLDFGSYPFVTSSTTLAAGACTGLGIAPRRIGEVFGIFKSYCTRVGSGPFPTELKNDDGQRLRDIGREYGATTGRPRRCGWLDIPALKYAIMLNGVTQLFMMKADVLCDFDEIMVCTGYRLSNGDISDELSAEVLDSSTVEPIYKSFEGWGQLEVDSLDFENLPQQLHTYISYIETETHVPINVVSLGPDRSATLIRNEKVFSN